MIRTIHIEGFKSVVDQRLELGRVNCLIGPNGSGKSNLLEALGLLGAAARGRVDDEALLRRGVRSSPPRLYRSSFHRLKDASAIKLEAESDAGVVYRVELVSPKEGTRGTWTYAAEELSEQASAPLTRDNANGRDPGAGLIAARRFDIPVDSSRMRLIDALADYAVWSPSTPALRGTESDPQTREPLGLAGGRLADGLESLMQALVNPLEEEVAENAPAVEAKEALFDGILDLIDWVGDLAPTHPTDDLLSSSVASTGRVIRFRDRFMAAERNHLTGYDASEGALYVLFAAILCIVPASPKILAVDNLDQALNPRLVTRLVSRLEQWLNYADPERQLLFTAHSPAALDGLDLANDAVRLFTVDRNTDGHTCCRRIIPTPELLALNAEYPLSRLWPMGHLGAVPNV